MTVSVRIGKCTIVIVPLQTEHQNDQINLQQGQQVERPRHPV